MRTVAQGNLYGYMSDTILSFHGCYYASDRVVGENCGSFEAKVIEFWGKNVGVLGEKS